jgi:hypothetical protein
VLTITLLEKNPTTRTVSSPTLRKACGTIAGTTHALGFWTWRSLVREQGLTEEEAVELMVGMVRCSMRDQEGSA